MTLLRPSGNKIKFKPVQVWQRWWKRQAPHRQDRFATLAPVAAVLLFLAAIVSSFWYLRVEEIDREQEAVKRDVEYGQQRLRLRLLERQEQIMRLARDISNKELDREHFNSRAESLVMQNPELQALTWIDSNRRIIASQTAPSLVLGNRWAVGAVLPIGETEATYSLARDLMQPVYGQADANKNKDAQTSQPVMQLHAPLTDDNGRFGGVLLGEYSIESLLRYGVPTEIVAKYAVALLDSGG